MPVTGYNAEKCRQRNRLAARRDGVNAAPVRFLRQPPTTKEAGLRYAHGTLPATPEAALARINALLPPDSPPLEAEAVYIHYVEAANGSFIPDRCMFMADNTLRNIARDAAAGVAFMNSHRTGGLSHPAELPFGKTFAGRYEALEDGTQRALVGLYMLRGLAPNGPAGPSTDDLHALIVGGTVGDVSVGLWGGQEVCDVCGADLDTCDHVPGTTHSLTPEQLDAQIARGVPHGGASYTLVDAHMGEVSAVFDGAVPGAGFRKALTFARARTLTPPEVIQARATYAALTKQGDFSMDEITEAIRDGFTQALHHLGLRPTAFAAETTGGGSSTTTSGNSSGSSSGSAPSSGTTGGGSSTTTSGTASTSESSNSGEGSESTATSSQGSAAPSPDPTQLAALQAENRRLQQEVADRRAERAATFAAAAVTAGVLDPAKAPELTALHSLLASGANPATPVTFTTALGTEAQATGLQLLTAVFAGLPTHPITREVLASATVLPGQRPATDPHAAVYEEAAKYAKQANRAGKPGTKE